MTTPPSHDFWHTLHLWKLVLIDHRTPLLAKVLLGFGALYGISPLDFIPDFIPLLGQLDDIGVIALVILAFLNMTKTIREDLWKRDAHETTAHKRHDTLR